MELTKKEFGTIIFALEEYAEILNRENSSARFVYELIWKMASEQVKANA